MDSFSFTAQAHAQLEAAMPHAELVDAQALVNWVRIVKSPAELALISAAATIVGRAMEVGIEAIQPGVRECDVVARICATQIGGTPEHWGDYPAALPSAPSGVKTAAPHLTWSGDRYAADTVAFLELAGCHHRYHAALARTICLGRPPDGLADVAAMVSDGLEVALDATRAGRTCHDVEAAWRGLITKKGYEKSSRIGYSIGLGYPPDWGERTASLRPHDMTVLEPDMCFHMILGMWLESWGYELSETFRVSAAGPPEVLTVFPRKLFVKPSDSAMKTRVSSGIRSPKVYALLLPVCRQRPLQLLQNDALIRPPRKDCVDDVRGQQRQPQDPADLALRDVLVVADRWP
jgi:Xaa-Pro dipeptidase